MSKTYTFYIDGMTCGSCLGFIEHALKRDYPQQFKSIKVQDLLSSIQPKETLIEMYDDSLTELQIQTTIEDTGFGCTIPEKKPIEIIELKPKESEQDPSLTHWIYGAIGCTAGLIVLILSLTLGTNPVVMISLGVVSVILTLILGRKTFKDASKKLSHGITTMDTLLALSSLAVLVVSITAFFVPALHMMFEMSLLILGFRHLGLGIEERLKEKLIPAKFQDKAPKRVIKILDNGDEEEIAIEGIVPGDRLRINPGEMIPLNGFCETDCYINTHDLDGQNNIDLYSPDKLVLAGVSLDAVQGLATHLVFRVQATQQNSYLATLDNAVKKYDNQKAAIEEKTDLILAYFIPAVIAISLISGVVIGLLFPPSLAITCAISVLVSACPCTLGLVIPLSVQTGMHKAANFGVRFKSSKILQEASEVDIVIFDLNGTLTTGVKTVAAFTPVPCTNYSEKALLELAYTLESHVFEDAQTKGKKPHAMANAIYTYAQSNNTKRLKLDYPDLGHHAGVSGFIEDVKYSIGSPSLMLKEGVSPTLLERYENQLNLGDSLICIARGSQLIGYVVITDPLRKDAKDTLKALKDMGKRVQLCTGANEKTALRYARALGITEVYSDLLPTPLEPGDKAKDKHVLELKEQGLKVAMIGDGINDLPAMRAADFSIGMASEGSNENTLNSAGAIINNGNLMPIANAFAISKQTVNNIYQNLVMSLSYNLVCVLIAGGLLVALGFTLNPAVGVALMFVQFCLVCLNVYRFKQQSLEHLEDLPPDTSNSAALTNPKQELTIEPKHLYGPLFTNSPTKPSIETEEKNLLYQRESI